MPVSTLSTEFHCVSLLNRHHYRYRRGGLQRRVATTSLGRLLGGDDFFCRTYSVADITAAPRVVTAGLLGFGLDRARHPALSHGSTAQRLHRLATRFTRSL